MPANKKRISLFVFREVSYLFFYIYFLYFFFFLVVLCFFFLKQAVPEETLKEMLQCNGEDG